LWIEVKAYYAIVRVERSECPPEKQKGGFESRSAGKAKFQTFTEIEPVKLP
jgi:hypothetical protein